MNVQTRLSEKSEKRKIADDFIAMVNPYKPVDPSPAIDLRAYARFVSENGINPKDITDGMVMQFAITK